MSKINNLLRQKRKSKGLTMKQVAEAVGVSEATVSRWESGNIANMGRSKIYSLSKILELSPSEIMGIPENDFSLSLNKHEEKVIVSYRNKPEMQPAVDKLLGIENEELVSLPSVARSETNRASSMLHISKDKLEDIRNAENVENEEDL